MVMGMITRVILLLFLFVIDRNSLNGFVKLHIVVCLDPFTYRIA